ncbi:SPOR domain-containing protein [Aliivibrio sp. S4TY2]|uniref:SPOR domain-containing protein n=1 Tax=Aliivibrio finisterrensis TaxID=511998 RepID=A0A4Q5KLJ2_9GAMM|nr:MULTISPECIES: SPOR domain-containing protein [Aliivibrio]MDD9157548.1 SPOR domain-containing protein [Aliivibrio sp. S4TY2]MDD9161489.1 SPOR domain-containing protein [Aliivibrio sp. S4TY1]MDD9165458.1 SPOR domain-containing protein [Aliivibrio sp. S4MY2]MDD9169518.1 SPOR domain-containing protein [Aliivibrio sp. S4MY4]MDD9178691.1 SPOR domain-containing protein [Aliivibrio sp. A6]
MLVGVLFSSTSFSDELFEKEAEIYRVQAYAFSSMPELNYKVCSSNILTLYKIEDTYYLVTDFTTYENAKDIVSSLRVECGFKSWIRPQAMDLSFTQDNRAY